MDADLTVDYPDGLEPAPAGPQPPDSSDLVSHVPFLVQQPVARKIPECEQSRTSWVQCTNPFILEVFAGSGRVTACLRAAGLTNCFGVDHKLVNPVGAVRLADLTTKEGQQLCMKWVKSLLCAGIFAAPPCGTASRAREIPLKGRQGAGPQPLRSTKFPNGIPGVRKFLKPRVSAANKLYEFVTDLAMQCLSNQQLVCIENPRSSLYWRTSFFKQISHEMRFVAHQACAYGSERPKWTALAHNHQLLDQQYDTSLIMMRATSGFQPKASKLPPLAESVTNRVPRAESVWGVPWSEDEFVTQAALLEAHGYPDMGVCDEMMRGVSLTDEVPMTGLFEASFKPAERTLESLSEAAGASNVAIFNSTRSSGSPELDAEVYRKTQVELDEGWITGPYELGELEVGAVLNRRFGLQQANKVRLIDNFSGSGVNSTVQVCESPKPHTTDVVAAVCSRLLQNCDSATDVLGAAYDLNLVWTNFFDDFITFCRSPEAVST
ncbi:unnamed protein product, partial [Effrenium voratum]